MSLQVGDKFPEGIEFQYIPVDLTTLGEASALACSVPLPLKLDTLIGKLSSNGKILIVSVPGAFTPTCTESHIPPYLTKEHLVQLGKDKNVETIIITSANDAFVLNAWGKLLLQDSDLVGTTDASAYPKIIFASDPLAKFSSAHGLSIDAGALGLRTARYALVVDSSREVKYSGLEVEKGVNFSGFPAIVAAKL